MVRRFEQADTIDRFIGSRMRKQREDLGMTQSELAERAGVSYQQIHKYEHGSNRISAGRLGLIAQILKIDVSFFYEDHDAPAQTEDNRLCLEVARNFRRLKHPAQRDALHMLVGVLAQDACNSCKPEGAKAQP